MAHGCGTFGGLAPAGATPRQRGWKAAGAAKHRLHFHQVAAPALLGG